MKQRINSQSGSWVGAWLKKLSLFGMQAVACLGAAYWDLDQELYAQQTASAKPAVILVRPADWSKSLDVWKAYRSGQYRFIEVDSAPSGLELRKRIAVAASDAGSTPAALVLCGDAALEVSPNRWRALTPGMLVDTQIQLADATTKELCTDALYGDFDGDGCPDLAIGRLPAKTPEELERMLRRSIEYEAIGPGPWNDRVHVTAGVGGFGFLADTAIETVTRRFLTDGIPPYFHMNVTVASCTSTYCPNPWKLRESYIERINQGGLFWVYIGHGQVNELDHYRVADQWLPIGQPADASKFRCPTRPPIALMLACFTGAYDARVDCFSEHLLAQAQGPIAVIGGSRVTMPYGLSQFASELINGCFRDRIPTLGALVFEAKRRVWIDDEESPSALQQADGFDVRKRYRKIVTDMAQALNPSDHDLTLERREHVRLMNLLGDPLLKIPYPAPMDLEVPSKAASGETIAIKGHSSIAGKLVIELAMARDRLPETAVALRSYRGTQEDHQQMDLNYQASNQLVVHQMERSIETGVFHLDFLVPESCTGRYVLCAYVYGDRDWSVGSEKIVIRKSK
ncbi:MAG: C25 family cysteine peptidase [Planctomycetota bacterium]|nr:C25 family cysteine peptidase [Planctomycetota bacterium]